MSYIKKTISSNEQIIGITGVHWIYLAKGAVGFIAIYALGQVFYNLMAAAILQMSHTGFLDISLAGAATLRSVYQAFVVIAGLSYLVPCALKYLSSEIALTDRRLIEKRGLFFVKVRDFDVLEISGASVDTGLLGKFLGYGYVHLDCRFIEDASLDAIPNPHKVINALDDLRMKITRENSGRHDDALNDIDDHMPDHDSFKSEKDKRSRAPEEPHPSEEFWKSPEDEPESVESVDEELRKKELEKEILELEIKKMQMQHITSQPVKPPPHEGEIPLDMPPPELPAIDPVEIPEEKPEKKGLTPELGEQMTHDFDDARHGQVVSASAFRSAPQPDTHP